MTEDCWTAYKNDAYIQVLIGANNMKLCPLKVVV